MTAKANDLSQPLDPAYAEQLVASMGGVLAMHARMREFTKVVHRMREERPALLLRYPNRWVGMAPGDAFTVGDSLEEVIDNFKRRGVPLTSAVVEHMDPDPPVLII